MSMTGMRCDPRPQGEYLRRKENIAIAAEVETAGAAAVVSHAVRCAEALFILRKLGCGSLLSSLSGGKSGVGQTSRIHRSERA